MTLHLLRPAPLLPLADMLARDHLPSGLTPQLVARVQHVNGKSWGFAREDGEVLACAGLMPYGPRELEAWFACLPELRRHMLDFVRLAQLTLAHAADDRTVTSCVTPGHQSGEKLARALGFSPGLPGSWTWSGAK